MKKSAVLVIVGLLAVVLFLQYLQRRNPVQQNPAPMAGRPVDTAPGGVPLPAEAATAYAAQPTQETRPTAPMQAPARSVFAAPAVKAGPGPLPTIPAEFAKASICPSGKSLNDILSSHGKVWGGNSVFQQNTFTTDENNAIYGLLAQFFSCNAVAYGDLKMCNFLPGEMYKKQKYFDSPNYQCVAPANRVLFYAYAAGRYSDESVCQKFLAGDSVSGARVPPEFCREVAKGFSYICEVAPAGDRSRCREAFPADKRSCRTQECVENNSLYQALKDNNISGCPDKYMTECSVFSTRSSSVCSLILDKVGALYCQTLLTHENSVTPEMAKKREEAQKKEQQKIMEEVNKNARKALGKE